MQQLFGVFDRRALAPQLPEGLQLDGDQTFRSFDVALGQGKLCFEFHFALTGTPR